MWRADREVPRVSAPGSTEGEREQTYFWTMHTQIRLCLFNSLILLSCSPVTYQGGQDFCLQALCPAPCLFLELLLLWRLLRKHNTAIRKSFVSSSNSYFRMPHRSTHLIKPRSLQSSCWHRYFTGIPISPRGSLFLRHSIDVLIKTLLFAQLTEKAVSC